MDVDFASLAKEQHRPEDGHFLIDVVQHEYHCSYAEALHRSLMLRDQVMSLFLRLCDRFETNTSRVMQEYIADLKLALRGSAEWCLGSRRYTHPKRDDPTRS